MLTLSIVIPSYQRADLLSDCLHSVQQHAPPNTQLIVVDDGSKDALISRTAARFPAITLIRHAKPLGFCRAANTGIQHATGDIVELLNDDTIVTPQWAEYALNLFRQDANLGSVAPLVLIGTPGQPQPRIDSAGDHYDHGGFAQKRGHQMPWHLGQTTRQTVFGASGSSAFYRRDLLNQVGCFPTDFGAYFEDVDLSWRIQHAGFHTMHEPASIVWHRIGASHQRRRRLFEQQSRNEERVFWRNVPQLRQALPRHLAVLCGKALRRWREGTFWPFAFGRLKAFAHAIADYRHRQTWQQTANPKAQSVS